jgi:HEPN domain-containing protein
LSTPPDSLAGTPDDWLRRARSNLLRAQQSKPEGVLWEDLCFDAQQAAEKALKALLVSRRIPFRFVHDIAVLITALEHGAIEVPADVRSAAILTDYAVASRYPGTTEPVTEEEYVEAVAIANATVVWVEQQLTAAK